MKVIVTGGAGFIGSAIVRHLVSDIGARVVNLDALTYAGNLDSVMRLAAESHVDRSIDGPAAFINTNIVGTYTLFEAARRYYVSLPPERKSSFRFHHISTDEALRLPRAHRRLCRNHSLCPELAVFGVKSIGGDHLVRTWHHTYGLPVVTTNCSNNYEPFHFPEKRVPLIILNALEGKPLPVYGIGKNVRD